MSKAPVHPHSQPSAPAAAPSAPRPPLAELDCGCGCAQRLMQTTQLLQRQREVGLRLQRAVVEAAAAMDAGECRERAAERRRRRAAGRGCGRCRPAAHSLPFSSVAACVAAAHSMHFQLLCRPLVRRRGQPPLPRMSIRQHR